MRLVSVAVLGRLLTPHDFGVVAAALSVIFVLHQVRDMGIAIALVQREDLDKEHVSTAFAFTFYVGIAIAAGLALGAPLIGRFYGIAESVPVMRVLGLLFLIRAVSTVPLWMCRRAMRFRAIALVDAASYTAGVTVCMTLAATGAGPWSLVIGYLVEESLSAVIYLWLQPSFSLRIVGSKLRDLFGFGLAQTLIQVANILAIHGDRFVVGRAMGAAELGNYTRAYELIKLPAAIYTNVIGNVLFPAFARLQHDKPRLAAGFRRATFANALILLPASAALIAIAPEAIHVVMGAQWDDAVLPFRILALSMLMRTSYKVGTTVASAAGSVYGVAVANVIYMAAVIVGAVISIRWGIVGVAASTAIAITLVYLQCSYLAMKVSGLPGRDFFAAHVPGTVIALVVGVASWGIALAMRDAGVSAGVSFTTIALFGALFTLACVALSVKLKIPDAIWLRDEVLRFRKRKRKPAQTSPDAGTSSE